MSLTRPISLTPIRILTWVEKRVKCPHFSRGWREAVPRYKFSKWFKGFWCFKHRVYPYGFKENFIGRLELNSSEKFISCREDGTATYKLSDIFSKKRRNIWQKVCYNDRWFVCWNNPIGKIYIHGMLVEHCHEIIPLRSEKVPNKIPGNNSKIMFREY